jgi:agmatinase
MPSLSDRFFDLPPEHSDDERGRVAILPVPWERTTSYGRGTAEGPEAIRRASRQVELVDEQSGAEPFRLGIASLPAFLPAAHDLAEALAELQEEAERHLRAGKFLVALGGEHSLTAATARAARRVAGEVGIVQLDAHADLRQSYEGTPHSHACVMRRLVEEGAATLAVGLRAFSAEERELIRELSLPVIWGWELEQAASRFEALLEHLPRRVYLTLDVDYFDPAIMPATGTPVPGGGAWYPTLALLRTLFREKEVVAMDLVELAPIPGHHAADFLAASLLYKCLGYLQESRSGASGEA